MFEKIAGKSCLRGEPGITSESRFIIAGFEVGCGEIGWDTAPGSWSDRDAGGLLIMSG